MPPDTPFKPPSQWKFNDDGQVVLDDFLEGEELPRAAPLPPQLPAVIPPTRPPAPPPDALDNVYAINRFPHPNRTSARWREERAQWMVGFGHRLREIRGERQLTARRLTRQIDGWPSQVSSWEHGRVMPDLFSFSRLIAALGLTEAEVRFLLGIGRVM